MSPDPSALCRAVNARLDETRWKLAIEWAEATAHRKRRIEAEENRQRQVFTAFLLVFTIFPGISHPAFACLISLSFDTWRQEQEYKAGMKP